MIRDEEVEAKANKCEAKIRFYADCEFECDLGKEHVGSHHCGGNITSTLDGTSTTYNIFWKSTNLSVYKKSEKLESTIQEEELFDLARKQMQKELLEADLAAITTIIEEVK